VGAIENSGPNRIHLDKYYFKNGLSAKSLRRRCGKEVSRVRKTRSQNGSEKKLTFVKIGFIGVVVMEIIFNDIVNYLNN